MIRWVKATIAADSNCNEYTTAPVSFMMTNANLILAENADNSTAISDNNGKFAAATLNTRTLYKDGRWNTLSGVRLNAKPTAKGLYIVNGKKVMIK